MDQKEHKEETFQAVIDGTENIKPKKKKEEKKGLKYELLDLVKTFVICFVCIFLLTTFVIKPVRVDGRSMYPTLEDGEIGLMNVFSAKFQDIKRFDVVVVYNEEKDENWVKRVIGLPGDTIYAKADVVYVNCLPLDEPSLNNSYAKQIRSHG
ncbi:signal peptidase I, partial [[Clostridium] innocuum]|nr:signal peptidase I [[Clostridium] innocuum]